ncbi:hypothetical protein BN59_02541 [Legionella massiliensis]|uniref:Uncharacterized protein n=1 Tax=Legionella massiliensis TaxID=1034943 RepID=A0A078L2J4_9GAMM|nr:hypothetical protein BN59_02541 [Legionella massiliensis]CEE13971.1 hypothetical protein BN1094_02541 [Legionella massiliensis]
MFNACIKTLIDSSWSKFNSSAIKLLSSHYNAGNPNYIPKSTQARSWVSSL